jgi:hypothetical protein
MMFLPLRLKMLYLRQVWRELRRGDAIAPRRIAEIDDGLLPPNIERINTVLQEATLTYVPTPYTGRIAFFRTTKNGIYIPEMKVLASIAKGGLDIYDIPGDHISTVREPYVQVVARKLRDCLDKAYSSLIGG